MTHTARSMLGLPRIWPSVSQDPPDAEASALAAERANLDAIRRRVMNVVGHALRTPMATLRGQAEVLARTTDEERRDELIANLLQSARRLEQLLDDVLVASEIDTRLPAGRSRDVPVAAAVESVWAALSPEAPLQLVGDRDAVARAPRDAVEWMLRHVLDNAVRYGRGAVEVTVETADDRVVVTVAATPRFPVADEELANAFELFYRGEGAVMDSTSRLGVGLTITRRLAERIGAAVELRRGDDDRVETALELPS